MKKTIILALIFIIVGAIFGMNLYKKSYISIVKAFNEENICYFLQEGVYTNEDTMKESIKDLEDKVIEKINNKYYVYVAITKDEAVAKKIKAIYQNKNINLYQKEKVVKNEEFLNNVTQFDLLIRESSSSEEILTIEEVVLANYEETSKIN